MFFRILAFFSPFQPLQSYVYSSYYLSFLSIFFLFRIRLQNQNSPAFLGDSTVAGRVLLVSEIN